MTTITDLIERLEKAEGPSRELDADIYEALGHEVKRHSKRVSGLYATKRTKAFSYRDGSRWYSMERLTASLDAAVALAKRVLPGWGIETSAKTDGRRQACVYHKSDETSRWVSARTVPIALVIATLKARAVQENRA